MQTGSENMKKNIYPVGTNVKIPEKKQFFYILRK